MESKRKYLILILPLIISPLAVIIVYIVFTQIPLELNNEPYYHLNSSIDIDDSYHFVNWKTIAEQNEWCTGNGTLEDPYIIENVILNVDNDFDCIFIHNSSCFFIIRNCKFSHSTVNLNTGDGIRLQSVKNGVITNNICTKNWAGIILGNCHNNTISKNNLSYNGPVSSMGGTGIEIGYSRGNTLLKNNINHNGLSGISVHYSNSNVISKNSLEFNRGVGISVDESEKNSINSNIVKSNEGDGINLWGSDNNWILDNELRNNDLNGISLSYCNNCIISENKANANGVGVYLFLSINQSLTKNVLTNNIDGIQLEQSYFNSIEQNRITNNRCGVYLDESNFNNLRYNDLSSNDYPFLESNCEGNIFQNNLTVKETYFEIIVIILIITILGITLVILLIRRELGKGNSVV